MIAVGNAIRLSKDVIKVKVTVLTVIRRGLLKSTVINVVNIIDFTKRKILTSAVSASENNPASAVVMTL